MSLPSCTPFFSSASARAGRWCPSGILQLLDVLNVPTFRESRTVFRFALLAANRLATSVSPQPPAGRPTAALALPRPRVAGLFPRMERRPGALVGRIRASVVTDIDDPWIVQTGRLAGRWPRAVPAAEWASHDAKGALAGGSLCGWHQSAGRPCSNCALRSAAADLPAARSSHVPTQMPARGRGALAVCGSLAGLSVHG